MNENKQIKIGAIISYLAIFISISTGILYTPWMIKTIGTSDYALYTLAMSLINTFMLDFGLSTAAQRYITKYLAEKKQDSVNNVVGLIYKLYFFIAFIIFIIFFVLFCFVENIYTELTSSEIEKFRIIYIIAAAYSILSFPFIPLNGMLSAYEKFIQLKLCDLINKLLSVGLTIAALIAGYGVYSLVLVHLFAGIIFIIVRLLIIKRNTPIKPNFRYTNQALLKDLFSFSLWSSASTLALRFMLSLAPSILGIISGSKEIAIFGYAVSLESYVYTFVTAINGFFLPKLSRISVTQDSKKESEDVTQLMISVGRFILILFSLIFFGFLSLGLEFINLLFGAEYQNSYYCVLLICGYGIVAYPQQIANTYVLVENKVKIKAILSLIAFVIDLILSFLLGSIWGAIGVSLAIFISLTILTISLNIFYQKKLHLNMKKFFKECHLKLLPGILIYAFASISIQFIPLNGFVGFFIKIFCSCCIFFLIVWFLMLTKQEKAFILKKGK